MPLQIISDPVSDVRAVTESAFRIDQLESKLAISRAVSTDYYHQLRKVVEENSLLKRQNKALARGLYFNPKVSFSCFWNWMKGSL